MSWSASARLPLDAPRAGDVAALAVGVLIAVYWARVLRLAWKQKRRTGRAGNLLPPEPLGRVLRVIWFPAVALWIVLPLAAGVPAAAGRLGRIGAAFRPLWMPGWTAWMALAVAAGAFAATWTCWSRMGRSWRMGIDPHDTTRLVVTGPYAWVRHPIYALSSLLMLCTMLIVPWPVMIGVGVVHLLLLQWEARREERHLAAVHGARYAQYAARTGRFVPRMW